MNEQDILTDLSPDQQLEILKSALLKIVKVADDEWEHMYGMEHGNGLSMGVVMVGKYAAKALKKAGLLDKHPILQAKVLSLTDRMKWG